MTPRVSVIVPVRNRRDLLAELFDSLDRQTFRDFEVIVVDDGSTDGSDVEAEQRSVGESEVKLVRSPGSGAVAARCAGVEESRGEILAFTDSDCRPSPRWLETAVQAIDSGAHLVNGLTKPSGGVRRLERSVWAAEEGLYPTCNVFYRRSAYECAGGFGAAEAGHLGFRIDRRSKGLGFGEDTILAWKVIRTGAPHIYVPDAVVEHHVFAPAPTDLLSREFLVASFPGLIREVPELRRTLLRWRVFLGSPDRLPVYLAVIALGLRRKRWAGAALACWVGRKVGTDVLRPSSWPERTRTLPVELALDLTSAVALVLGSVKARTLVL